MADNKLQMDAIFHALADATRRDILKRLSKQPSSVTKIAAPFAMSLNAVSKHLKVLEKAALITRVKNGREYYFVINQPPLDKATKVMEELKQQWEARLDQLENYLQSLQLGDKK